ncbi:hypothetical protein KsCSTR_03040 [Candidatus Kuenenia stuttgartiensis]|uniref:Uncharacterized protein n=1 Tax=Kuenenia stuttgartiensis TaxID=174633 RepID=Q1PY23_KUEST|nr:hypothetical protein KsCSTR_03040 [Candidatus Kuenenia stuttgartiensis]CAJ72927.1 unknown protein [Candidatus Kuenenia stuttgartiensis]
MISSILLCSFWIFLQISSNFSLSSSDIFIICQTTLICSGVHFGKYTSSQRKTFTRRSLHHKIFICMLSNRGGNITVRWVLFSKSL